MKFYKLNTRTLWKGIGNVLITGITDSNSVFETMTLQRTGPFVPNICIVPIGRLVMTKQFKEMLEKSEFSQLEFRKVILDKIVLLDWQAWDGFSEALKHLPESRDPDDFILQGIHNPEIAREIGELWECVLPWGGVVNAIPIKVQNWLTDSRLKYQLELRTRNGLDLFSTEENSGLFASQRAMDWFVENDAKWLQFEELEIS